MSLGCGILGLLNYGPMSGYELAKAFGSSLRFFWYAQTSHVYLELKKLERKGLVTGKTVLQSDRPNKRVFTITEEGRNVFLKWLAEPVGEETTKMKSAFLMKVFFSGNRSPKESAAMLRQFEKDCEEFIAGMGAVPGSIENYGRNKETYQTLYWQFVADFGLAYFQTCIDWARRCAEKLEGLE